MNLVFKIFSFYIFFFITLEIYFIILKFLYYNIKTKFKFFPIKKIKHKKKIIKKQLNKINNDSLYT